MTMLVESATTEPDVLEVIADLSNDEVFTPPKVASAVLDLLPSDVWTDPTLRWLDPGCKTGIFLREITRRLMRGLVGQIPDERDRLEHILKEQVFGIAITELTALISWRTLYLSKDAAGDRSIVTFDGPGGNIWFERIDHSYENGRCTECGASKDQMEQSGQDNHAYGLIHASGREAIAKELDMNFDVVIGNPPYQMGSDGGTRTMPLYNQFVDYVRALSPRYISMIIPARWMAGGLGLDTFRASMLSDDRIRKIVDYPNSAELFPTVDIKSGICYFLWDRDNPGACDVTTIRAGEVSGPHKRQLDQYNIFVRDMNGLDVLKKVEAGGDDSMYDLVRGKNPFGFRTNYKGLPSPPADDPVRLYRSGNPAWVERDQVLQNAQWIDEWKVLIPKAGPGSSGGHVIPDIVLGQPIVGEPKSCCTETYIVIGPVSSEEAANSLRSYLRTRFVRFLVSLRKISQDAPRATYSFVPVQTWDREWTDEELYKKYGLTTDEQAYIESMIREMA